MSFDEFIAKAWNDHGDAAQAVADRIPAGLRLAASPADVAALARLATHVFGEHLARWDDGVAVLEAMRESSACDAEASRAIARGVATLRHAGGAGDALDTLTAEDRVAALAGVAAICCGQARLGDAVRVYAEAIAAAPSTWAPASPATRALAVAGNNIAAALEEKAARTPAETLGMVDAAEHALRAWTLAGTWLERERALYRLSCSLRHAGRVQEAAERARECIAVCEAHAAPAFERFFGWAALARAAGSAAQSGTGSRAALDALRCAENAYAGVAEDERRWCDDELAAARATVARVARP